MMKPAAALMLAALSACLLAEEPTRTATPAPRLSGGFGKPRATAAPTPAADSGGQSFSDVVQAAHTARDGPAPEKGGLTIDNKSLVKSSEKGRVTTSKLGPSAAKPGAAPTPARTPAATTSPSAPASETSAAPATEAQWKEIAANARKRVTDDKARVAELEAATKKLENDFYAWDDGQYRDRVIKPAWDHSRSELDTAKQELAAAEADLTDLPERARKAGALPGWIRE